MSTLPPTPAPAIAASGKRRSRRGHFRGGPAILLILLLAAAIVAFRGAGRWLVRVNPLTHADVILVLSGSMPYRAEEAAAVYRAGYAPEVWLTRPFSAAPEFQNLGVSYIPDEEYNRQVLMKLGVPAAAIRVLPEVVINTEQEVLEASREMQREGKTSLIIVTSPEHTRRSALLWGELAGEKYRVILHGAPQDPFDADHWWRNTRDALAVFREYLGLLNAWLGLPVRPHSAEPSVAAVLFAVR